MNSHYNSFFNKDIVNRFFRIISVFVETYNPYKIKVDVLFETEKPQYIQEFYEALGKEDAWIDKREKVTWKQTERGNEISFFFKS